MGLFGSLLKTTIHVATAPIEAVKDVVTMNGIITDQDETYTVKRAKKILRDIKEVEEEIDDL